MSVMKHFLEKTGMVAVEGGEIAYRLYVPVASDKEIATPLIFSQGGPGGCGMAAYDRIHPLANDRPVLFYDQLGSYYSPADLKPEHMRLERFASEIGCLMDALGFEKAHLLGQSFGAAIMTQYTVFNPDRVAGLILSGPYLSTSRWIADCHILLQELPEEMQATIKRCEADGLTDSDAYKEANSFFWKKHVHRRDPSPDNMDYYRRKGLHNDALYNQMWGPSEFTCTGTLKDMDLFPYLHEIKVPTRLICGEFDTARQETVRDAASRIERADVIVLPSSGHSGAVDSRDDYLAAVQSFFLRPDVSLVP